MLEGYSFLENCDEDILQQRSTAPEDKSNCEVK